MTSDPTQPNYVPTYTGAGGDYGKGDEFGIDLFAVYKAGLLHIPTTAGHYAGAVTQMHAIADMLGDIASDLEHVAGWGTRSMARDVADAMRVTTNRLYDAGAALVGIADTYQATDRDASDQFAAMLVDPQHAPMFDQVPPRVTPPAEDDPADPSVLPEPPDDLQDALDEMLDDAGIEDPREQADEEDD